MRIYVEPAREQWPFLIRRVNRDDARINWRVSEILQVIKDGGDAALINVISEVEGAVPANLRVTSKEFDDAVDAVPQDLKDAILEAASRIRAFHELEIPRDITWNDGGGIVCSRRFLPLQRAGIYIPGGTAPLFSTVLMLGIPSGIAGCPERMICTPPSKEGTIEPAILYAARVCGIDEVYKVGGAQAIAAMAYGTGTIRKVSKIFG
ncbi:MAG: histidinol dehydrogenase, partial [Bacteroidales bacterium]|nr:histidinol dehydrogenase [Bacteroidales bacterium]